MATIKNTLALEDKMSKTLLNITKALKSTLNAMTDIKGAKIGESFKQAQRDINAAENAINSFGNTANNVSVRASNMFSNLVGFELFKKGMGMVVGQVDSAIARLDTLNNFPKVMANLGIKDTNVIDNSINRLKEGLDGLPTTLDEAVMSVQRFTSKNKSLEASTEMFLALNNALLAGGASATVQSSALEQVSQAYSKNKPDMAEWRSILSAMPAQADQLARKLKKTGIDQLGDDLRKGKTSMNEFMKALMELNQEGIDKLPSLAEQAANATGGIETNIKNFKTAITKGLTDLIQAFSDELKDATGKTLAEHIKGLGKTIQKILVTVAKYLKIIMPLAGGLLAIMITYKTALMLLNIQLGIKATLERYAAASAALHTSATIGEAIATDTAAGSQAILNTALLSCPIFWVVAGILALIAVLGYLWNTNDEAAYTMLLAWDGLVQGLMAVKLAFMAIFDVIAEYFEGKVLFMVNLAQFLGNALIGMINAVRRAMDMEEIDMLTFADDISAQIQEKQEKRDQDINDAATNLQNEAIQRNLDRMQRTKDREKLNASTIAEKAGLGANSDLDIEKLMSGIDDTITSDGKGGKAVKTKNTDKLLSDEDIQLLLDVATRDYQLNYQQVTPNISVTFGDVRETADVDQVLEAVGTRVEEIINGDGALEY